MLRGSSSGVKHYCNAVNDDDDEDVSCGQKLIWS